MAKTLLSNQHFTAQSEAERDSWYGELDRQLAALKAGTPDNPLPDWYQGGVAEADVQTLVMDHTTTVANGYFYCKTEISSDVP